jgi:hypothetical protein
MPGRGLLRLLPDRGCGLLWDVAMAVDWTRSWTVRGHGYSVVVDCSRLNQVRGQYEVVAMSESYCVAVLRMSRDYFADRKSFGTKG